MMNKLAGLISVIGIALALELCGCQTTKLVPVYIMPTAPAALIAPLPDLQTIKKPATPGTKSDVTK